MSGNNLKNTADRLEAIRKIVTNGVWLMLVVLILAGLGHFLLSLDATLGERDRERATTPAAPQIRKVEEPIAWGAIDQATLSALEESRAIAESFLSDALDTWIDEIMVRVDGDFLDWYFDYWTQQAHGLKGLWQFGVQKIFEERPSAAEKLTQRIQEEFAKRALRPNVAELELRRIARQTAEVYVAELQGRLKSIPETYKISSLEWDAYMEGIALTTADTTGGRETPLTLKALALTGAGGAAILISKLGLISAKVAAKTVSSTAGAAAAGIAAKTGGKVAAKAGGKFLGPIIGVGVIVWDLWDHRKTKRENRPILRQGLVDYFQELKEILMHDPTEGLISTLNDLERQAAQSMTSLRGKSD